MTPAKLLIVGTPIGNLSDISARAVEALRSVDTILCEDTRHSLKLLRHLGIEARLESYHDHNEQEKAAEIAARLMRGEKIALISDAGLPVLSDPGFRLTRLLREQGLEIEPVAGPFAAALALVASGLPPLPFAFFGFTPHRSTERIEFYKRLRDAAMTTIVYESPIRLLDSLRDALSVLGSVDVTIAREMTKMYEEFVHGTIEELIDTFSERPSIAGEVTIVFGASDTKPKATSSEEIRTAFRELRDQGIRRGDAIKLLAERYGIRKNELYRQLTVDEERDE